MKKILHISIIVIIANIYYLGIYCSNFSDIGFADNEEKLKDKYELSFISNSQRHTSITGEILNINYNITPYSSRVPNFLSSYTNNQLIALCETYFYLHYIYPEIVIVKLKTRDIIFPFHYFW